MPRCMTRRRPLMQSIVHSVHPTKMRSKTRRSATVTTSTGWSMIPVCASTTALRTCIRRYTSGTGLEDICQLLVVRAEREDAVVVVAECPPVTDQGVPDLGQFRVDLLCLGTVGL